MKPPHSVKAARQRAQSWPWNGRPSSRHVWKQLEPVAPDKAFGHHDTHREECLRCGRRFVPYIDEKAPTYCFATREWMAAHPEDDGKEG